MGHAGQARAREHFSRPASLRRWNAALASVAGARPLTTTSTQAAEGLALLTVSHNSATELATLLRSVERHLPGTPVVVVDCASADDSVAVARARPHTVLVPLPENVGFGRACNAGLGMIGAEVTALVNPDVELLDDSLLLLAAQARRRDEPERLLAPLVMLPDGSRQDSVHPVPASGADLARALMPPALLPGRAGAALAPWRSPSPRRVGWAVGCALVARTETLRSLGPFDEQIFMYGEDLDLGLRAARAGIQTWFWPAARVLHTQAHASARAFGGEPFELLARARHDVVARRMGTARAIVDDAAQATTFASRAALKRLLGRPSERERRQLRALIQVRGDSAAGPGR
jgi:GT2 family glycosyltransferase